MTPSQQLREMWADYRQEAEQVDRKIDFLALKVDRRLAEAQNRLGNAEASSGRAQLLLQSASEDLAAIEETLRQARLDLGGLTDSN